MKFEFVLIILSISILRSKQSTPKWVDTQFINKWYNSFDLCMVQNKSNASVDTIMKSCESLVPSQQTLPPIRCRAGNTWPSKSGFCSASDIPFNERKNLQRSVEGYDDPSATPLASFFKKLSAQNGAMLLIGDSVMQQFFSAVACELEREGVWSDPSRFSNTDEVQYVKVKGAAKAAHIKFLPIYHFVNGRWDRVANASMHHMRNALETMVAKVDTLVVVLNMGLHYVDNPVAHFSRSDYQAQMTMALSFLHQFALRHASKTVKVFFRETTAQHFPTPNGYWPGVKYSHTMKLGCVPLQDASAQADWRNRDIDTIVKTHNLFKVEIVRFYDVTAPLWSEHPNGHMKDCTHFCWSPMLYQPIFHRLDQALS